MNFFLPSNFYCCVRHEHMSYVSRIYAFIFMFRTVLGQILIVQSPHNIFLVQNAHANRHIRSMKSNPNSYDCSLNLDILRK